MPARRKQTLASLADEVIPFRLAVSWAGIAAAGQSKAYCPFPGEHGDGGQEPALRVYDDSGYCFAEGRYFSVSSLLAAVWELSREDAAAAALRRYGWKPAGYAHLWEGAAAEPEPDRESLAAALRIWCEAQCPDWKERQYQSRAAERLARCLGLLPLVRTEEDCRRWLDACREIMRPYLF